MASRLALHPYGYTAPAAGTLVPALGTVAGRAAAGFTTAAGTTMALYEFLAPVGYTGVGTVSLALVPEPASGSVSFGVVVERLAAQDGTAPSWAAANVGTFNITTGAGSVSYLDLALANDDGIGAGSYGRVGIYRNNAVASNAAGTVWMLAGELRDGA